MSLNTEQPQHFSRTLLEEEGEILARGLMVSKHVLIGERLRRRRMLQIAKAR